MKYDVFISHASEDKIQVAIPLANSLKNLGVRVWIDEFELTLGDSLRRNIEKGLLESRFGVVILSSDFIRKEWTNRELDGLMVIAEKNKKTILPIWHNVSREEILKYSPILADKLAVSTEIGIEKVAQKIMSAIQAYDKREEEPGNTNVRKLVDGDTGFDSSSFRRKAINIFQAGGALPPDSPSYVERIQDKELLQAMQKPYGVSIIWGPRQIGKTSMLIHSLRWMRMREVNNTVVIDLQAIGGIRTLAGVLFTTTSIVSERLGLKEPDSGIFSSDTNAIKEFISFILNITSPTILAFDETDSLMQMDILDKFIETIRLVNSQQLIKHESMVYIIIILTPPAYRLLRGRLDNFCYMIRLSNFNIFETEKLLGLCSYRISKQELELIHSYTGGQPPLVQATAQMIENGEAIQQIFEENKMTDGKFGHYLFSIKHYILNSENAQKVISKHLSKRHLTEDETQELCENGILKWEAHRLVFTSKLYEEYITHLFTTELMKRFRLKLW